jgi:radical SAM superfamily enzyme YgiQ (UPF0313 family)
MKFLFVYPPGGWAFGEQKVPLDPFTPPLGILYLSRILEEKGHTIEIIDFCAEPLDENRLRTAILSSDAFGMSVLTFTRENAIKLSGLVKEIDADIPFVIGGPCCSLYPKQSLSALNAEISVEGEEVIYNKRIKLDDIRKAVNLSRGMGFFTISPTVKT